MEEPIDKKTKRNIDPIKNNLAVKRIYYKNPENQLKLRERIQKYTESRDILNKKINELSQFLIEQEH